MVFIFFKKWPDYWGIPFVIWANKGKFYSKVRLNKILSVLQRDGFPIENKFKNYPMGPFDKKIDTQVHELAEKNILTYKEEISKKGYDVTTYKITPGGESFVKEKIIPSLNELPYQDMFLSSFKKAQTPFFSLPTDEIIKNIHEELYLDDIALFVNKVKETKEKLADYYKAMKENFADFCSNYLDQLGILEFTISSLGEIYKKAWKSKYTGKNHAIFNSEKLLDIFEKTDIRKYEQFKLCKKEKNCLHQKCPILNDTLDINMKYRFHCLEYNSGLYNILAPIDYRNYEFTEFLPRVKHM